VATEAPTSAATSNHIHRCPPPRSCMWTLLNSGQRQVEDRPSTSESRIGREANRPCADPVVDRSPGRRTASGISPIKLMRL
jgi:hypothetical protein